MVRKVLVGLAAMASGLMGPSALAKDAADTPGKCELHFWPTDKFAVTENLGGKNLGLAGALMDDAMRLKSPESVKDQLATQLGVAEQTRIFRELNVTSLLKLDNYDVVIEPADSQPVWTWDAIKSAGRISSTAPLCYAELAIISQQYLKQAIGSRLRTFFRYREYGPNGALRSKVLDTTATKAERFPASAGGDIAASASSVQAAFRENLIKIATEKLKR